jgi:hypothetical protein
MTTPPTIAGCWPELTSAVDWPDRMLARDSDLPKASSHTPAPMNWHDLILYLTSVRAIRIATDAST